MDVMLRKKFVNSFFVLSLSLGILFSVFVMTGGIVRGDVWTDDFTGDVFDPRWTEVGDAIRALDGDTNFYVLSYHDDVNLTWHGSIQRAQLSLSYEFNISVNIDCEAEKDEIAKAEVRFLDSTLTQVYAFSWSDESTSDVKGKITLRGRTESSIIFSTGNTNDYSIFLNKDLSLSRAGTEIYFYLDGTLLYTGTAVTKNIQYIELGLLKYEEVCPCVTMQFDMVSVDTTPSALPEAPISPTCLGGDGSIDVSWSPPISDGNSPIIGYGIYRGTSPGGELYLTNVGDILFYNDTALTNGQTYYYKIAAVNEVGEGPQSVGASAIPQAVPGQPTNLQAIAGDAYVNLGWEPPLSNGGSAITSYTIYRGVSSGTESLITTLGAVLSYNDTTVTNGQEYYYRVGAVNALGEGALSDEITATPGATPSLPAAPRNLQAIAGDNQVILSWSVPISNGNSPITNYGVYRGSTTGGESHLTTVGNLLSYTDTGLANGQSYYYQVSAINTVGESGLSNEASGIPDAPTVPSAPQDVQAIAGDGQIMLQWSSPLDDGDSSIIEYEIYRGNASASLDYLITIGNVFIYTDTGLTEGVAYYYRISAVNDVGEGIQSTVASATITGPDNGDNNNVEPDTGLWSPTASMVTVILLGIAIVAIIIFMRKPKKSS